jgi:hypothetical protein
MSADALAVFIVTAVPIIQVASSPGWIFTPAPTIDPWVYHGYFLHLREHISAFSGTYYGTRLAWIFPGYLAHHYLSPLSANLALRLFLYLTAVLSSFFFVRRWYGTRCGLVTSLLLCSFGSFLLELGWDYVDGAGIAYGLLAVEEFGAAAACLRERRRDGGALRAIFGGAAFAAAVHSNFFLLVFSPLLALLVFGRTGWKGIRLAIPAIAGGALLTICFGVINHALGGAYLFFWTNLLIVGNVSRNNAWYSEVAKWIGSAWWLVIPVVLAVVCIALLIEIGLSYIRKRANTDTRIYVCDAALLPLYLTLFVFLTALGSPVLQLYYYASYLMIVSPIAMGAIIGRRIEAWSGLGFALLTGFCAFISVLIGTGLAPQFAASLPASKYSMLARPLSSEMAVAGCLAAMIVIAKYLSIKTISRVLMLVIPLGAVHIAILTIRVDRTAARDAYLEVTRTSRELGHLNNGKPLWFWYSTARPDDGYYTGVSSTYLWGYRLIGFDLPETGKINNKLMSVGSYLAVMNDSASVQSQAVKNLGSSGITVKPLTQLTSTIGVSHHVISLMQIADVESPVEKAH